MSTMSEQARASAKSKASRLANAKVGVVDASGWKDTADQQGNVKTGMRPLSRRQFKRGGKVAGMKAQQRADRKARAKGGGIVDDYFNVDQKKANQLRDGDKFTGGLKAGGRAQKAVGGPMMGRPMQRPVMRTGAAPIGIRPQVGPMMRKDGGKVHADEAQDKKLIKSEMHKAGCSCAKCHGGRAGKASGGTTTKNMSRKQREAASFLRRDMGWNEQLPGIRAAGDPKYNGVSLKGFQRARGVADYLEKNQPKFIGLTADRDPDRSKGEGIKRGGEVKKEAGGSIDKLEGLRDKGGREARASGGKTDFDPDRAAMMRYAAGIRAEEARALKSPEHKAMVDQSRDEVNKMRAARGAPPLAKNSGGRTARKAGGRTKKSGMNVNIIIAPAKPPMPPAMGPRAPMAPGAGPVGMHQGAPPPAAAPAPMQPAPGMAQMPPQMRKRGGRTYPLKSGGGGGLGRLEKIEAYG